MNKGRTLITLALAIVCSISTSVTFAAPYMLFNNTNTPAKYAQCTAAEANDKNTIKEEWLLTLSSGKKVPLVLLASNSSVILDSDDNYCLRSSGKGSSWVSSYWDIPNEMVIKSNIALPRLNAESNYSHTGWSFRLESMRLTLLQRLQALLGLPTNTSAQITKKAFMAYSLKNHPDKNLSQTPQEKAMYKAITSAYNDAKEAGLI